MNLPIAAEMGVVSMARGVVSLLLAIPAIVACSGLAQEPHVASLRSVSPSPSSASSAGFEAFERCMQSHGFPVDEISSGNVNTDDPRFQSAQQACSSLYKQPPDGSNLDPRIVDRLLRFAQCMRAHGIPMSDPLVTDGAAEVRIDDPRYGPNSAEYRAANAECRKYMTSNSPTDATPAHG